LFLLKSRCRRILALPQVQTGRRSRKVQIQLNEFWKKKSKARIFFGEKWIQLMIFLRKMDSVEDIFEKNGFS
jgi:hypothetical protein